MIDYGVTSSFNTCSGKYIFEQHQEIFIFWWGGAKQPNSHFLSDVFRCLEASSYRSLTLFEYANHRCFASSRWLNDLSSSARNHLEQMVIYSLDVWIEQKFILNFQSMALGWSIYEGGVAALAAVSAYHTSFDQYGSAVISQHYTLFYYGSIWTALPFQEGATQGYAAHYNAGLLASYDMNALRYSSSTLYFKSFPSLAD